MMQILDVTKWPVAGIQGYKDRNITKTLATGDKELRFSYPRNGQNVEFLMLENYIRTESDEYVIKRIVPRGEFYEYTAALNVEGLEEKKFVGGYSRTEKLPYIMMDVTNSTGWVTQYVNCDSQQKVRTIELTEPHSGWDLLQKVLKRFRVECSINSIDKIITISDRIGADRGAYMIDGVNLRDLTAESDTYDWYTRIIPIGKDGLQINIDGKNYVENYQYSTKPRTYIWKDERYTSTESLIEDATDMLEDMSMPMKAYTADVVDLAAVNPENYGILAYDIGDTILAVSRRTGIREKQRIVKMTIWPEAPEKNTVEISTASKSFAEWMSERMAAD